ncbi:MAG: hypothetical protein HPY45_16285 [Anaerolineae bacterium]|nr:hypothetical protein [Anaerolineae bacterium]
MKSSSSVIKAAQAADFVQAWKPMDLNMVAQPETRMYDQPVSSEKIQEVHFPEIGAQTAAKRVQQYEFASFHATQVNVRTREEGGVEATVTKHLGAPSSPANLRVWVAEEFQVAEEKAVEETVAEEEKVTREEIEALRKSAEEILIRAQKDAEEARLRTEEMIKQAQMQAERLLQEARAQRDQIFEEARTQGIEAARTEAQHLLGMVATVLNETKQWRDDVLARAEEDIIGMVQAIAQKLFGNGYRLDASAIEEMVGRAITEAARLGNLRVYMHPEDQSRLLSLWQESELVVNGQKIQLVASQEVLPGGCFIEGEFGSVDSRIEAQLALIQQEISSTLKNREEMTEE